MEKPYYAISLFSGAMGLDLGIERAGFTVRVCVEKDRCAASTIRLNTDIPVVEDDISNVTGDALLNIAGIGKGEVSLVVGGPPCQAFSTAGRQRGLNDERGNLILQYLRIVREIRPAYFIMENVRGLLSAKITSLPCGYDVDTSYIGKKGGLLFFLLDEFHKIGYSTSYALLNSANYGVPEKRERVVVIGHIGERVPIPSPTHSEKGLHGTLRWTVLGDVIRDLENENNLNYLPLRPKSIPYMQLLGEGQNWRDLPADIACEAMGKAYHLSGGKTGFLRRLSFSQPSPTLVTSPTMPATLLCHPTKLRPLSIEEYARIQQFPDNWKFCGNLVEIYRQIGNAVPVGLGYAVGCQVMRHIKGETSEIEERNNQIPYSRYTKASDIVMRSLFDTL